MASLKRPRRVMLLVKAGPVVDAFIEKVVRLGSESAERGAVTSAAHHTASLRQVLTPPPVPTRSCRTLRRATLSSTAATPSTRTPTAA